MAAHGNTYGGNKSYLEQKPCAHCGRSMTWRKKWAKNWDSVRFCSQRCRKETRLKRRREAGASDVRPNSN